MTVKYRFPVKNSNFTGADIGILNYHFELGADKETSNGLDGRRFDYWKSRRRIIL